MGYKSCEMCGSKMLSSGLCSYCDEEALIVQQNELDSMNDDYEHCSFSNEFMEKAKQQNIQAKERLQNWKKEESNE